MVLPFHTTKLNKINSNSSFPDNTLIASYAKP
jgi:hypothetical protein